MYATPRLTNAGQSLALCAALLAGLTIAIPAQALEFNAATELGVRYESNARRSNSDEQDDVTYTPSIIASATHQGNRLSLDANYELSRRIFQEDFFEDENRFLGYANVDWEPLTNRLSVRATQTRQETTRQSFGLGTQADRQILSRSEVAPLLRFQVRGSDELQLEYQYTDTRTEDDNIDNESQSATARYVYSISQDLNLTLSATRGETRYEFAGVSTIDFTTFQAGLNYSRGRNQFRISGGESSYERAGQPDAEGPIWDASWSHQFSAETSFRLAASRSISDGSDELLGRNSREFDRLQFDNSDLTDVFENDVITFDFNRSFGATAMTLRLERDEADYELAPRDEERSVIELSASRAIRRAVTGQARLTYLDIDFVQLPTDYEQIRAEISALWDVNRRFEVEGGVFLISRDGEGVAGNFDNYGFFVLARYFFAGQNEFRNQR